MGFGLRQQQLPSVVHAEGTSSSGAAGTTVCELDAGVGYMLIAWFLVAANGSAGTSQIVITYTDLTTTTVAVGSSVFAWGQAGSILTGITGAPAVNLLSDKPVRKVRVETTGAGVTIRTGQVSALKTPS